MCSAGPQHPTGGQWVAVCSAGPQHHRAPLPSLPVWSQSTVYHTIESDGIYDLEQKCRGLLVGCPQERANRQWLSLG